MSLRAAMAPQSIASTATSLAAASAVAALLLMRRTQAKDDEEEAQEETQDADHVSQDSSNGAIRDLSNIGGTGKPEIDYGVDTAPRRAAQSFQVSGREWTEQETESAVQALREDGVICLRGVWSQETIFEFRKVYDHCWERTKRQIKYASDICWQKRVYQTHWDHGSKSAILDKILYHNVPYAEVLDDPKPGASGEDRKRTLLVRMGKGRYDFESHMEGTVLHSDKFYRPQPVFDLLRRLLGPETEWLSYSGGLPAEGACGPGRWHRDTFSLWDEEGISDGSLPPFYFTMIAPLTHVRTEDGPTQFRLGSHKVATSNHEVLRGLPLCSMELAPGDVMLFDGRMMHRGGPRAKTAGARHALYCVHSKWWYSDDDVAAADFGFTNIDPVSEAELKTMRQEEPWLAPYRPAPVERLLAHTMSFLTTRETMLGVGIGCVLGYVAAKS